jgi:hypothetical protein
LPLAAALLAALWLGGSPVQAAWTPGLGDFQIRITTSSGSTTITDNLSGDLDSDRGLIDLGSFTRDGFKISGLVTATLSDDYVAQVSLSSVSVQNMTTAANSITIEVVAKGFYAGTQGTQLVLTSSFTGAVNSFGNSTVTYQSYADALNRGLEVFDPSIAPPPFKTDPLVFSLGAGPGQQLDDLQQKEGFIDVSEPYSLSSQLIVTLAGSPAPSTPTGRSALLSNGGITQIVAPEPATVSTGLLAVALVGGWWCRQRKKSQLLGV